MLSLLVVLQATLTIAVAGPPTSTEYLPLRVAAAEGYFAEEKLDVSIETTRAEAVAAEALGRQRVELAATSVDAALQLGHSGGKPPRLVFGFTAAPPVALLVPAARKDAIRSLADLVGQTVGISVPGSPGELALLGALAQARVAAHKVSIQSLGDRGVVGAIEADTVAAGIVEDPWATRLVQAGQAAILADFRRPSDAARWLGEPTVHAGLFVRSETRLRAAELVPLSRALLRALKRIAAAEPGELEARLPAAVVGAPEDFALRLAGARGGYLPDGWVTADMLGASLALARIRSPFAAKVNLPRSMSKLLLTDPLAQALGRQP